MNRITYTVGHALAAMAGINLHYTVRRLGYGYKRSETRGVAIVEADTPREAFQKLKEVTSNDPEKGNYFVLAEARIGNIVVESGKGHAGKHAPPAKQKVTAAGAEGAARE